MCMIFRSRRGLNVPVLPSSTTYPTANTEIQRDIAQAASKDCIVQECAEKMAFHKDDICPVRFFFFLPASLIIFLDLRDIREDDSSQARTSSSLVYICLKSSHMLKISSLRSTAILLQKMWKACHQCMLKTQGRNRVVVKFKLIVECSKCSCLTGVETRDVRLTLFC